MLFNFKRLKFIPLEIISRRPTARVIALANFREDFNPIRDKMSLASADPFTDRISNGVNSSRKFLMGFILIIIGIIMPIFIFGGIFFHANQNKNANLEMPIIFALKDPKALSRVVEEYQLRDYRVIFEAKNTLENSLPKTIVAKIKTGNFLKLKDDQSIFYAEKDDSISASVIANDTFFTTDASQEDKQWYLAKVKVPEAWGFSRGSNNVTVALVDTGVHAAHIELNDGRVIGGFNTLTNTIIEPGANSDDNGHGTAVAGVIGAIPNNSRGVAGINWFVKIMPVKALRDNGTGEISTVAAGIVWAADNGANIINLSLGGHGFGNDQTLNNAIAYAYNKGAVIVAAAGNDLADNGSNLDASPVFPICADQGKNMVIGVAATDINDQKAAFSNFGINCVDISAPGKKILTTAFLPSDPSNNVLIYGSGTSLAAPVVSGVAALIKANHPNYSNVEISKLILKTADNIDNLNQTNCLNSSCNGFLGKGRINAEAALLPQPIFNGSVVRDANLNVYYYVDKNLRRPISDFVFAQRFTQSAIVNDSTGQLSNYQLGDYLPPLEGTLIKSQNDPTVYVINQELKRPLTYLTFLTRNYSFAEVKTVSDLEITLFKTGDWYWPPDGTLVLINDNPTVYVMDKSVRRPVTYFVFTQRKLSFTKVLRTTLDEFSHVPAPTDNYWLAPLDGTLVKTEGSPSIFVLENAAKRELSYDAFIARKYKFGNVKTLPNAEMDVIAPGLPIF